MSAKQQALQDISEELSREGKSFIAFRSELNPIMRKLVSQQINQQLNLSSKHPSRSNCQLMAHCFFSKNEVKLNDYQQYFNKQ